MELSRSGTVILRVSVKPSRYIKNKSSRHDTLTSYNIVYFLLFPEMLFSSSPVK